MAEAPPLRIGPVALRGRSVRLMPLALHHELALCEALQAEGAMLPFTEVDQSITMLCAKAVTSAYSPKCA